MEKHKNEFIKRTKRRDNFVVIGNEVIQDNRMTIEARGVLVFLLSLPQDWVIRKNDLQKRLAVSRRTIDRCFDEMKQCGYLCETDFVKKDGKFDGKGYLIYDYSIYKNAPEMYSTDVQGEQRSGISDVHSEHRTDAHGEQLLKNTDIQQRNNNNTGVVFDSSPINPVNDNPEHLLDGGPAAAAVPAKKKFVKPTIDEVAEFVMDKYPNASKQSVDLFAEKFWSHYENKDWSYGRGQKMKDWKLAMPQWKKTIEQDLSMEQTSIFGKLNASIKTNNSNITFNRTQ